MSMQILDSVTAHGDRGKKQRQNEYFLADLRHTNVAEGAILLPEDIVGF